ncbi:MAG: hypothetical protein RL885_28260 [Planctomycetota bacterium]
MRSIGIGLIALFAVLLLPFTVAAQDDVQAAVTKKIEEALAHHKAGEAQKAIEALQEAIAEIEKSQSKGLGTFLPKAPSGWKAGEIESNSMSFTAGGQGAGQFLQVTRDYWREKENGAREETIQVSLTNAPQMVQAQQAMANMYKNPQMLKALQSQPGKSVELIEEDDWFGWLVVENDDATVTAFCNGCLVTVTGSNEKNIRMIWDGFDLKGLAGSELIGSKKK